MSKPKNWPTNLPYLRSPLHAKDLTPTQVQTLRTKPPSVPSIPPSSTLTPSPNVKIQAIHDLSHPADGQYGLFAARDLKPGAFILAYLGRVHGGVASSAESDYDLWVDREADVAVDAAAEGNEGRFVNDFRGIGERANAVFGMGWCERWGEVCVCVWVVGGGRGKKSKSKGKGLGDGKRDGIRKGEEILVSYGKGFWGERRVDEGEDEDCDCGEDGDGDCEGEGEGDGGA